MEKKRVMVVDDEENFLKITKINLEKTGRYVVDTVSNASNIIERVRSFNPDIIMLDILMPKISGFEVCKILKADPVESRIPVIAISALDTEKDKIMMYGVGVIDFLVKPIEMNELISKIETALQSK